ncbi:MULTISPECIES: alpha-amylase family protein [Dyadobacter]|uniref:Alpha-amylase family protein n=1 Tax=Dyadobacter chenhuakuii TaxID=2909339 RepID=A0A9X1Q8K7_9BACT|nr:MULTISPECIES: alpha-amylase family protein [Dyadobacter]MCE7070415.1 alpha-amylase family protein [Dyadobacter sp. CY327]MCF2492715.1 alpha-amylase family protein [Dyadobacter chenhuakuii]MCF2496880.1 alpha-amylase family protein [Dyadobacter chenhuakuii]MCF2520777.1 alpha-amylase family protein [Dyadobacter sp. CY351]USJ32994.1 alpha-amylase family protein [Dyadobacter chenhuakuii]
MLEDLWYKNAVIYSLDLETFMDANGDGTGDFEGLCNRLDYLHALGLDTIWLAPFQPTPNRDNGYDISDFYGVDPRHGSSGDFVSFIHKARKLGIKVIIDLVVNHTSDEHRWFKEARSSKDSPKRDWYVWSEKRPADWNKGMVFPGVQKATWTKDKESKEYYFHRFYEFQPDLNTDNPEVREEINKIMGYWLELGIAGFRVDAVPFILESSTSKKGGEPALHFEYLKEMRKFLQWRKGDAVLLGEANVLPNESKKYFGEDGDGIHLMFNFFVNQYTFYALATADTRPLIKALEATRDIPGTSQWAHFLRNHDELDLGRLTEEERQTVFERFGPEKHMQLYDRGIRRRLSPMLGSRQQTELAYSLMFSLPGTPVIRYGDEIGMGDNLELEERDAVRTPMQWTGEKQGGFSQAETLVHPVVEEGYYAYDHVNVENQRREPSSLLNWMTSLIRMRKECPEIGYGNWEIMDTGQNQILGMRYTWKNKILLIWHNFQEKSLELVVPEEMAGATRIADLMSNIESVTDKKGRHTITLEAYGYRWFRAVP